MLKLIQNSILTVLIGVTPVSGLEHALAQSPHQAAGEEAQEQDRNSEQAKEKVKHDHTEAFYTKTYTVETISALEKELKEHPTSKGYVRLSDLFYHNRKFKESEKAARQAIKTNPRNWQGYYNLSTILSDKGNHPEAIKQLRTAQKISPANPEIFYNLGAIEFERGNLSPALRYMDQAINLKPNFQKAVAYRREILNRLKK